MKWRHTILGLPKYLVQLVMTLSCAGFLPVRCLSFDPALSSSLCSCPQVLVLRVIFRFPYVLTHCQSQRGKLPWEVSSPPFWHTGKPRTTCVSQCHCGKLIGHMGSMCLCRSSCAPAWPPLKRNSFWGFVFTPSASGAI